MATSVAGYSVLPVLLRSSSRDESEATHYLYLQAHAPRLPDADSVRSLFVVNVPTMSTETHFRHLFGTQLGSGRVERVQFQHDDAIRSKGTKESRTSTSNEANTKKRKRGEDESAKEYESHLSTIRLPPAWDWPLRPSGSHAVVTFVDRPSMEASLKAITRRKRSSKTTITWGDGLEDGDDNGSNKKGVYPLGSARYNKHAQLRYPSRSELLRSVNDYMRVLGKLEEAREREARRRGSVVDEDGFVTVTRGARRTVDAGRDEEMRELVARQREKSKGLEDFYRFQMREKRKERQGELLRRFEEDKKRVEEMKRRRGRVVVSLVSSCSSHVYLLTGASPRSDVSLRLLPIDSCYFMMSMLGARGALRCHVFTPSHPFLSSHLL